MDDLILKGEELLKRIEELSNETEEIIIEGCGYDNKYGYGKSSKRAFFRNYAEAFIKSRKQVYEEKEGIEFKNLFLQIREKEYLDILPKCFSDGYGRWVFTLILLGVAKIAENGKLKLGSKKFKEKSLELGLTLDQISSYRTHEEMLPQLTSKETLENEFPELDIKKAIFDEELINKTKSLEGFTKRHIAIECGFFAKETEFKDINPDYDSQSKIKVNLKAYGRALQLAKKSEPIPRYKTYDSYLRSQISDKVNEKESSIKSNNYDYLSETNREEKIFYKFLSWMLIETDLAEKSIKNYLQALSKINDELIESDLIKTSLQEISEIKELENLKDIYFSKEENKILDVRGKQMYSSSFNKFIEYKSFDLFEQENLKITYKEKDTRDENFQITHDDKDSYNKIESAEKLKIHEKEKLTGQKLKKFVLELFHNSKSETSICIRSGYEIDSIGSFRRAFSKAADVKFGPLSIMVKELKQKSIDEINRLSNSESEDLFFERELSISTSKRKIRSTKFRDEVLTLHGYKCACCEIKIGKLLEAAHIIPVTNNGSDNPSNGIPLCPTHHTAFDNLLFTFNPDDLSIILSEGFTKSELAITSNNLTKMTDKEALKVRFDFFEKGSYL